jgi:hypothetical protein
MSAEASGHLPKPCGLVLRKIRKPGIFNVKLEKYI